MAVFPGLLHPEFVTILEIEIVIRIDLAAASQGK
jgi:hypothetical protein